MKRLLGFLLALEMCFSLLTVAAAKPHFHIYIPLVIKAATCTETGTILYTCFDCGNSWQGEIPATGHDFSETWQQTEEKHWRECENFACNETTDVGNHFYEDGIWLSDETNHWKACAICGYATGTAPHTWDDGKVTIASTCVESGIRTYTCTVCGATRTEPLPLGNHSWDGGRTTLEPTVTEKGESLFHCIICGETSTREIAPLGLSMTPEELLTVSAAADNVLNGRLEDEKWVILQAVTTEEEYTRIQGGWPITVTLEVKNANRAVSREISQKVEKAAGKQKVYCYLDMALSKALYQEPMQIANQTAEPVIVALTLPQEMMEAASKRKARGFSVYKIEDDSVKKVAAKLSEDGESLLLQTDKFGTYALAYRDVRTSGFDTLILFYAGLGLLTLGGIGFLAYKLFFAKGRKTDCDDEQESSDTEAGEEG